MTGIPLQPVRCDAGFRVVACSSLARCPMWTCSSGMDPLRAVGCGMLGHGSVALSSGRCSQESPEEQIRLLPEFRLWHLGKAAEAELRRRRLSRAAFPTDLATLLLESAPSVGPVSGPEPLGRSG